MFTSLAAAKRLKGQWVASPFLMRRLSIPFNEFATLDPDSVSEKNPAQIYNFVGGQWTGSKSIETIIDPLNGEKFLQVPNTEVDELQPFISALKNCPKSGLHNPLKSPERYNLYGDISWKAASSLSDPKVEHYFARLIQRVSPKSLPQATAEVVVTRKFLQNFSGDQVRFLARSFTVPGDHRGQRSEGMRWPYGPVAIITPFNFPLEIPALQLMGALYMGNRPTIKADSKVSVVLAEFLRLLHACGLPPSDADLIHCGGPAMNHLLTEAQPGLTLFTGSSRVAEKLAVDLRGKCRLEDAGFDWKLLGEDTATPENLEYVAWVCDQDAYACSGQKCSAQSILFMHSAWAKLGLVEKLRSLAGRRQLSNLTVGPVLTVSTAAILEHVSALLRIPGASLEFGGKPLRGHSIPEQYGAVEPTAVFVPLREMLRDAETFSLVTKEIFGPFQILTEFQDGELPLVLESMERMKAHLTAAVVSNDSAFLQTVLESTVNGTTYAGVRARTTGAPQNHWFGPCGDPRAAGIGSPEAIKAVWSGHREVIYDKEVVPQGWSLPVST